MQKLQTTQVLSRNDRFSDSSDCPEGQSSESRQILTKIGGTTYLDTVQVITGAPTSPPAHVSQFYKTIDAARSFEWQFRISQAFKEYPMHQVAWVTLTYAVEPITWEAARLDIKPWLKSLKDFTRRVVVKEHHVFLKSHPASKAPGAQINPDERTHYIVVEEEGKKAGRKHFHALIWSPYKIPIKIWEQPLLKWKHGFQKIKRVDSNNIRLAIYIGKYATKNHGRTLCNYNFGLMTVITLLSISAFRLLMEAMPTIAVKLLRRVSLTANYPTFKQMTYLISRAKSSTTSRSLTLPLSTPHRPVTGLAMSGYHFVNDCAPDRIFAAACSSSRFSLVRSAIVAIRAAVSREILSDKVVPGLHLWASPTVHYSSTQLEPDQATAVWLSKSRYPRCQRHRARVAALCLEQSE